VGRAYPRVIGQQRERSWMIFDVFFPMVSVIGYVLIYKAIGAPTDYIGFVVVGGAMTAFWMNILWSMSSQLYWEKETGNLSLYIASPAPMMGVLLGMAIGGLVSTLIRAIGVILLGSLLFQVTYSILSYPMLLLIFFLSITALYGMGMMTASIFLLLSREAWHLANLAQEPIFLVSGFYFPLKFMPFWVSAAASLIPLTLGLDGMRQLVFASGPTLGFLDVKLEAWILAGLAVVFIVAAKLLLDYMERLAIREGRITESRR
ncbi:ABC transporter permease, partial [bacterium]|nr:ABC transporter permease [bacterium]